MSGIKSSGIGRATVQAMIDAGGGGGSSIPTAGVTPDLLTLALGPQRPAGGVWYPAGSTTITYAGAFPGSGVAYHGSATQTPDPYGVKSDSAAVPTNSCGLTGYGTGCPATSRDRMPWMLARLKLGPVAGTCGWFVGLFKGNLVDHTTYPDYCIAFTCSSDAGETTWQLGSRDGAATSKTDTLVPVTAGDEYSMYLQIEGAGLNDVRWVIYNHTSATEYSGLISGKANLPGLTDPLGPIVSGVNVGAISHTIYLSTQPVMVGTL